MRYYCRSCIDLVIKTGLIPHSITLDELYIEDDTPKGTKLKYLTKKRDGMAHYRLEYQ